MRVNKNRIFNFSSGHNDYSDSLMTHSIHLITNGLNPQSNKKHKIAIRSSDVSVVQSLCAQIIYHHNVLRALKLLTHQSGNKQAVARITSVLTQMINKKNHLSGFEGKYTDIHSLLKAAFDESKDEKNDISTSIIECIITLKFALRAFKWVDDKTYHDIEKSNGISNPINP